MADADRPRTKTSGPAGSRCGTAGAKLSKDGQLGLPCPRLPENIKTPDSVQIRWSGVSGATLGVWAQTTIPAGTKFAPYQGEKVISMKKESDPLCVWEIVDLDTNEFLFYVDATHTDQACWLKYVQRARHLEEQNVLADQEGIDIIYTTMKAITKGEELLTWFKMPSTRRGQRQAGRESRGKAKSLKDMPSTSPMSKTASPTRTASPKKKPVKIVRTSTPKDVNTKAKQKEIEEKEKQKEKVKEEKEKKKEEEKKQKEEKERKLKEEKENKLKEDKDRKVKEEKEKKLKEEKERQQNEEKERKLKEEKERKLKEEKERKQKEEKEKKQKEEKERKQKEEQERKQKEEQERKQKEEKEREIKEKELREKEIKERELKAKEIKDKELKDKKEREKREREMREKREREKQEKETKDKALREKVMKEKRDKEIKEKKEQAKKDKEAKEKKLRELKEKELKEKELKEKILQENELKDKELKQKVLKEKELKEKETKENERKQKGIRDKEQRDRAEKEKQVVSAHPETDNDLDRDSSDLEIDLDQDEEDDEEDDEDSEVGDVPDMKSDGSKSTQSEDPEKFHFKLNKDHITKSRHGRKVFKCDICSGIYRHAFSLKRHYIRNHINLRYVSRGDIMNCQINPDTHDLGTTDDKDFSQDQAESLTQNKGVEPKKAAPKAEGKPGPDGHAVASVASDKGFDTVVSCSVIASKNIKQEKMVKDSCKPERVLSVTEIVYSKDIKPERDLKLERADMDNELNALPLSDLYRCNVCSSFFDTVALLKSHIENHPNLPSSKAFACDQCDMKFSHKQNLRRHLAVHTGEKPFVCKFCSKMFPTATNQKRHERIHLGRRVACDYCSSTFTQSGDLKKHIRKLHPESFHECAFCGKYFTDEVELIEHVSSHNESMQSNEAERHRRRQAFKVDMELDRVESMRLAEQKLPGVKFACTVCKKRFLDYANMCRHRRLAHQRHLLMGGHGSNSSSPVPSPTKLASDSSDGDPQAFFYANIANNISENLINYIEGKKEHLEKAANQMKLKNKVEMKESPLKINDSKPELEPDVVNYNFPTGFCLEQNYRKVAVDQVNATFDNVKNSKATNKFIHLKETKEPSAVSRHGTGFSVLEAQTEINEAKIVKAIDLREAKTNREECDTKPVISTVNGVSLNIPVFNLSNSTKREIKTQPVCTVQPIQRQIPSIGEQKSADGPAPVHVKKSVVSCKDKPSVASVISKTHVALPNKLVIGNMNGTPSTIPSTPAQTSLSPHQVSAVKVVPKSPAKPAGGKSNSANNKVAQTSASCLALKIPQVHVCPVCRRLFNSEILFRQHMIDKHKTTPEDSIAQKEKELKGKCGVEKLDNSNPVMDLSGKKSAIVTKPVEKAVDKEKAIIEHDEGARLLLDFALGIRDEPESTPPPVVTPRKQAETIEPTPLDLSGNMSASSEMKDSKVKSDIAEDKGVCGGASSSPIKPCSSALTKQGDARAPAAHNNQGKVQGVLRIPMYHPTKDLDLPAPLISPPGTPRSPWLPANLPSLCGPLSNRNGASSPNDSSSKKFICTVCYGEFPSRASLHNHQRATHTNVWCDHVEVDSDVVAPWWQKPSPVGMLNVCSSQMSEYDQADQRQFKCTKCNKAFKAVEELHTHIVECARIGKQLLKQANKAKLPLSTVSSAAAGVKTAAALAEAEAAAAAVVGLRLLASSTPWHSGPTEYHPKVMPVKPPSMELNQALASPEGLKPKDCPSVTTTAGPTITTATTNSAVSPTPTFAAFMPGNFGMNRNVTSICSPNSSNTAPSSTTMLERFKSSILKNIKKRKKKRELEDGLGLMTKKRRRSLELLYNPLNHVRRREMTEVVDMQRCQGCGQRFTTISLLERHIPMCSEKERLKEIQIVRNPLDPVMEPTESRNVCHYCNKQFTYLGMLRKHVFAVCQVRKAHITQAKPLDISWEQELAQHNSGPTFVDISSNDGSQHTDDAASVTNSTCSSSHDTDVSGQRLIRKKRKNHGWGNGKKKRHLSGRPHVSSANVQEEEEVEEDLDGDDLEDDLEDETISNGDELPKLGECKTEILTTTYAESSQSGDDELQIVEDSPEEKDVTEMSVSPAPLPSETVVKEEPPIVSSVTSIVKYTPTDSIIPKQQSFIGRHTLPFVLSIPQYRTPLAPKPKSTKVMTAAIYSGLTSPAKQNIVQAHTVESGSGKPQIELKNSIPMATTTTTTTTTLNEKSKPTVFVINPKFPPPVMNKCLVKTDLASKDKINSMKVTGMLEVQSNSKDKTTVNTVQNSSFSEIISSGTHQMTVKTSKPSMVTKGSISGLMPVSMLLAKDGVIDTSKEGGVISIRQKVQSPRTASIMINKPSTAVVSKSIDNITQIIDNSDKTAINIAQTSKTKVSLHATNDGLQTESIVNKAAIIKKESKIGGVDFQVGTSRPKAAKKGANCIPYKLATVTKERTYAPANAEQKLSTPSTDSEESSDEENIKEIINTVLALTRQGQKPKVTKPRKQTKQELKILPTIEKAKPEQAGSNKEQHEKVIKQTKRKSEQDNMAKPAKSRKKCQDVKASKLDNAAKKDKNIKKKLTIGQNGETLETVVKKDNKAKRKIKFHDGEFLIPEEKVKKKDDRAKKAQSHVAEAKPESVKKADEATKKNTAVRLGATQKSEKSKKNEEHRPLSLYVNPVQNEDDKANEKTMMLADKTCTPTPAKKVKAKKKSLEHVSKDTWKDAVETKKGLDSLLGKKTTTKVTNDTSKPKVKAKKKKVTEEGDKSNNQSEQQDKVGKTANKKGDNASKLLQAKAKGKVATKKTEITNIQVDSKDLSTISPKSIVTLTKGTIPAGAMKSIVATIKKTTSPIKTSETAMKATSAAMKNSTISAKALAIAVRTAASMVNTTGTVKITVLPAKSRKRKVTPDITTTKPMTAENKNTGTGGPSPVKVMKTRGGAAAVPTKTCGIKRQMGCATRRVSVRGSRTCVEQVSTLKTKVSASGQKSVPPKLKRLVGAGVRTSGLDEKTTAAGKNRTIILSPSMRTRKSRLSL